MELPADLLVNRRDSSGDLSYWDMSLAHEVMRQQDSGQSLRTSERTLEKSGLLPGTISLADIADEAGRSPRANVRDRIDEAARRKRWQSFVAQLWRSDSQDVFVLLATDGRGGRRWVFLEREDDQDCLREALVALSGDRHTIFWPHGRMVRAFQILASDMGTHDLKSPQGTTVRLGSFVFPERVEPWLESESSVASGGSLTHLDRLEAESIHIIREVVAQADNPVMLYSVGKDSSVMLHLAMKAFYPARPPFPLMHVDTRWKFQAMYEFRDQIAEAVGMDLIVHINPEGIEKDINPFDHGSALHTDIMKTVGLKQALDKYNFDVAFGGARRDEEKSRAKERIFSFRTSAHRWEPKNQRPELWRQYNGTKRPGESIRVFPLSNWTELDIWQYIYREEIPIVPLYYAAERPVIERDGMLMMVDDDRMRFQDGDEIQIKKVRFRTLGCYPLTGAIESDADDLSSIVLELLESRTSERQGRAIDSDASASMEKKKQEGYF